MYNPPPDQKIFGLIYRTTHKETGKKYIGQTSCENKFENYYGSGVMILNALRKHGKEAFNREVIDWAYECQEELDALEIHYIEEENSQIPTGYNIQKGGHGEANLIQAQATYRERIGAAHSFRNENDPYYRKMVEERGAQVGWNREVKYRSHIPVEEMVDLFSQGYGIFSLAKIINQKYKTQYASSCLIPKLFKIIGLPFITELGSKNQKEAYKQKRIDWARENQGIIQDGLKKYRELYPMPEVLNPQKYK